MRETALEKNAFWSAPVLPRPAPRPLHGLSRGGQGRVAMTSIRWACYRVVLAKDLTATADAVSGGGAPAAADGPAFEPPMTAAGPHDECHCYYCAKSFKASGDRPVVHITGKGSGITHCPGPTRQASTFFFPHMRNNIRTA